MIQEACIPKIHDVSTQSVDDLVEVLGTSGISPSQVSSLCEEINERVGAFPKSPS